jgi:hypothetical protein
MKNILLALAMFGLSTSLLAGTCEVNYTRAACPGQEEVSYKKCDGKASCTEFVETADAAACQAEALKACENKRLDITKSKVITATFDGAAVKSASGKDDFCADYANRAAEFDHCQ